MVHLDYRDGRPIYSQVIAQLRRQIVSGALQANEKLPSVREMAARLAINPNTIQRAYRHLEAEGWIITVPRKGCFACQAPETYRREMERLLQILDETCQELENLGVTREEIQRRLEKEGSNHA